MLKLCLKDWLAARWAWAGSVLVFGLYILQPRSAGFFFPVLGGALVFACLFITFALDERSGVEELYGSLPLTRATIVRGRYALAGFLAAAGSAVFFGAIPLLGLAARSRGEKPAMDYLLSIEGGVGFLFAVVPAILIFMPFCFRYGFGRGSLRFAAVVFVAGALAAVAAGPALARSPERDPLRALIRTLSSVRGSLGTPFFIAAAVLVTAALTWLSLATSLRAYERREL